MDPVTNPFVPGAGNPPPELAGRDDVRETVRIAIERARIGRPTKSLLMVGLRGVGKTVLLDRMRMSAEETGIRTLRIEAPEKRSLPALIAPELRVVLLRLSKNEQAKELAQRALRAPHGGDSPTGLGCRSRSWLGTDEYPAARPCPGPGQHQPVWGMVRAGALRCGQY